MLNDGHQKEGIDIPTDLLDLPSPIKRQEILEERMTDDFCKKILAFQVQQNYGLLLKDNDSVLCRRSPREHETRQVVLPALLCYRVLKLGHHTLRRHTGQTRLHETIRSICYWLQTVVHIATTVRECTPCENIHRRLVKRMSPMMLVRRQFRWIQSTSTSCCP